MTAGDVAMWVNSRLQNRNMPSVAVRHNRRIAARLFFRVLGGLGLYTGDPTLDIQLPARRKAALRSFEDDKIAQIRLAAHTRHGDTRLPAAVALGEAGIGTGELAAVTIGDTDLADERVWVRYSSRTEARWAYLNAWGARRVRARVEQLLAEGGDDRTPLVCLGQRGGASAQPASCLALNEVLAFAGLAGEPGIKPGSFAATYARGIWDDTRDIGLVADAIGRRSQDATAKLIGLHWQKDPEARAAQLRTVAQARSSRHDGAAPARQRRATSGRRARPETATAAHPQLRTVPGMNVTRSRA